MRSSMNMFCVVCGLAILSLCAGVASATTIYVDGDNTSGPWDGTIEHPYQTIQNGVDGAGTGDTVYVFNGTYYENVTIDRAVALIGEDRDSTIIDGGGIGDVIFSAADSLVISGFTVRNGGDMEWEAGIELRSVGNTVSGNRILSNGHYGLRLFVSSGNNVMGNDIMDNLYSISLEGCSSTSITGNTISNTTAGVRLYYSSDGNTISGNVMTNVNCGVYTNRSAGNIILQNMVTNDSTGTGVYLYRCLTHNEVAENWITGCHTGIRTVSSSNCEVSDNIITDCSTYGIRMESNYCSARGNTIEGVQEYAMWISGSRDTIVGNVIRYNANGMTVGGSLHTIGGNIVEQNDGDGMYVGGSWHTITENEIRYNRRGIYLADESARIDIKGNTVSANDSCGVYLRNSDRDSILNNDISDSHYGMFIFHLSSDNVFRENNITSNTFPVWIEDGSDGNRFFHNVLTANAQPPYDECTNDWDDGYLFGGNYWSDYTGDDEYRGADQNISGPDGIGDVPYVCSGGVNQDSFPLMEPWADINAIYVDAGNASGPWDGSQENPYQTIAAGLGSATTGDTVVVYAGWYQENLAVTINMLTVIGEGEDTTIIDGGGSGNVVHVMADAGSISGFTMQASGPDSLDCGIFLDRSVGSAVGKNTITGNTCGIFLLGSSSNEVMENEIVDNSYRGMYVDANSSDNVSYHNNFIGNTQNAYDSGSNSWYGTQYPRGNYWDDYSGVDEDTNGIGDTPYAIAGGSNQDMYPLMAEYPYEKFIRGDYDGDMQVSMGDVIDLLKCLYVPGSPGPDCWDAADTNDDGRASYADALQNMKYLYVPDSPPPSAPFPDCGEDPTEDELNCITHPCMWTR